MTQEDEIYARALAIMVQPGRRLVVLAWALSCALAIAMVAGMATFLALALDRSVPVKTLKIDTSKLENISPGGSGELRYRVNRRRACPVAIQRVYRDLGGMRFVDPKDKPLYVPAPAPDELGVQEFSVPIRIDPEMDPGQACGSINLEYYCNPLQRFLNWPVADRSPRFCWNVGPRK